MTNIQIFQSNKKINLETFIDSRALICANSGGGKSYAIRKILEETNDKVMAIILDVEGEFKTLREKFDFMLIGQSGDVPLNQKASSLLPRKLLELEVSTIIDISELKMHERVMYAKRFLEALMEVPRELWKPCIVVLDEAHLLAGQQEKQESTHAVIDLMTRGRKRGFCGILCSQRISKLHKDAVAEANNYLVGRTGLDIDMKRASEILGFTTKEQFLSLRDLEPGEFYVFGTALSHGVEKEKIAEVKTTHPKVGMDIRKEIIKPTEKILQILNKISDLPKEAEQEIKDKEGLIRHIKELKRELSNKPKEIIKEEKVIEVTDKIALEKAYERGAKETERRYASIFNSIKTETSSVERAIKRLISDGSKILESKSFSIVADKPAIIIPEFQSIRKETNRKVSAPNVTQREFQRTQSIEVGDIKIGRCEKMIYSFLYNNPQRQFSSAQVGSVTGYSSTSGGFNNALSKLRSLNLIKGTTSNLQLNDLDSSMVIEGTFEKENIMQILGKCEKEIYQVLLENSSEQFSKEQIAERTQTNYSANSGGFSNSLSRLNSLGLIKRNGGMIQLNPELLEL